MWKGFSSRHAATPYALHVDLDFPLECASRARPRRPLRRLRGGPPHQRTLLVVPLATAVCSDSPRLASTRIAPIVQVWRGVGDARRGSARSQAAPWVLPRSWHPACVRHQTRRGRGLAWLAGAETGGQAGRASPGIVRLSLRDEGPSALRRVWPMAVPIRGRVRKASFGKIDSRERARYASEVESSYNCSHGFSALPAWVRRLSSQRPASQPAVRAACLPRCTP